MLTTWQTKYITSYNQEVEPPNPVAQIGHEAFNVEDNNSLVLAGMWMSYKPLYHNSSLSPQLSIVKASLCDTA